MQFYLSLFLVIHLFFVSFSQAASNNKAKKSTKVCQNMQILLDVAEVAVEDYKNSQDLEENPLADSLVLSDEKPTLEKSNKAGKDLWSVPVVVDGEGCYGHVEIKVKAGTCEIVGEPSFDGVSCTDD